MLYVKMSTIIWLEEMKLTHIFYGFDRSADFNVDMSIKGF